MKQSAGSIILNILGVLGSIILSIVFVLTAFALPVYYSVAGMIQPKALTTMVQSMDYAALIKDSDDVNQFLESLELDAAVVDEVIKSEAVGNLLEDCTDKLTTILGDVSADLSQFDAAFLQDLVNEHLDEILTVVEEKTEIPLEAGKEEIKQAINTMIEESAVSIEETVMELEPLKETLAAYDAAAQAVQATLKWQYMLYLALIEVALLALIYLMRMKHYGGFVWIAVDTGIVGVLVSLVALALGSNMLKDLLTDLPEYAMGLAGSALGNALNTLTIAIAVCFAVMILSIVACVLLRARKRKVAEPQFAEPEQAI